MLTTPLLALLASLADTTESRVVVLSPAESIHVELTGQGQPVVLIPGLFGAAYGFRHMVPLLSQARYRSIVIEPLAIGRSSRPDRADYSTNAQAGRIAAVLDSLKVRDVLVIAHSIAGALAFRLAVRRPDLVAGILSLEGGPAETMVTSGFRRAVRFGPAIKLLGGVELIRYHHGGVPAEEIERLRRSLREFSVDSVPGAGHYLHEERPVAVARP